MDPKSEAASFAERDRDTVCELPSASQIEAAASGDAFHHHHHHSDHNAEDKKYPGEHQHHNSSRVALDHFDPEGVHELKRTITQHSVAARSTRSAGTHAQENVPKPSSDRNSVSENTIVIDTEQEDFDFEQVLKDIVKK